MSDSLQRAIAAIRSGDKEAGKRLLAEVIRNDPRNETAWLWMSVVIDSDEHRRTCLERVLAINPCNETARRGLEALGQSTSDVPDARSARSRVSQELSQSIESKTVIAEGPDRVSEPGLPTSSVASVARHGTRKNAMQTVKRTWSGGLVGKLLIGCGALIILSCVCAVPVTIFGSPTGNLYPTPPSELAGLSAEQSSPVVATKTPLPTFTLMPPSQGTTARVLRIIDGDTIEVEIDGVAYRLRYIGMDTPEQGMLFFAEATQANADLVAGREVRLEKDVSETDRYGRLLRYVYVGDTFVNAELVRQGFAQVATYPLDVKYQDQFRVLQQEAQAAARGLWAQAVEPAPTAVPPAAAEPGAAQVVIRTIFYDGAVPRVESDEFAEVANQGGAPVDLGGWRLNAGAPGQDFNFPSYVLEPGQACRVYTNESHPESCGFSFGNSQALWNNKGDCGYLYDASDGLVGEYCY